MLRRIISSLAIFAIALVCVSVASAHKVTSISIDCFVVSGDFTGFPAGLTPVTFKVNDTVSDNSTPVPSSVTYSITGPAGHFGPFDLPAPAGTTSRSLTITWSVPEGSGKLVVPPVKVNCPVPVTPPVTPPAPPVAPPAPPVPPAPPAVPATPVAPPAKPKPKPLKPKLSLKKVALDKNPVLGKAARFTLLPCNTGDGDAHNVVLYDDPGTGLTLTARNGGNMSDGSLVWQVGTIKAHSCHPLQGVQTRVDRDAKGNPCNNGTLTASNAAAATAKACVIPKQPKKSPPKPPGVNG